MQLRSRYFSALEQFVWVIASYRRFIQCFRALSVGFICCTVLFKQYDLWKFFADQHFSSSELNASWTDPWPSSEQALETVTHFGFGQAASGWVEIPNLKEQLLLVSLASRPDAPNDSNEGVYIYLQGKKKVIRVLLQRDYGFVLEGSLLSPIVEEASPDLHIRFLEKDEKIWAKISLLHNDGSLVISPPERLFFPLASTRMQDKDMATFDTQYLSNIGFQWAGKDLLYGEKGEERHRITLLTSRSGAFSVLYIAIGECLFKDGETWEVALPSEKTRDKVIFQLDSATDQRLAFSAWDLKGRLQKGLLLSKVQEYVEMGNVREMRLSAVRSSEKAVVQWRQHRVPVYIGDILVLQNGHSDRGSLSRRAPTNPIIMGTYIVVKGLYWSEGRWQLEMDVYSDLRSKMIPCTLLESGLRYREAASNDLG